MVIVAVRPARSCRNRCGPDLGAPPARRRKRPSPGNPRRSWACSVCWLEPCGEMAQSRGLGEDAHAGQIEGPVGDLCDDLDHVVDMALGVGAAGDGEADQVHRGRGLGAAGVQTEHHRADLAGSDAAFEVQGAGECLPWISQRVDVRQHCPGVDKHGVAAERHDYRHPSLFEPLAQVLHRAHAVAQVVMIDGLAQSLGDRLHVPLHHSGPSHRGLMWLLKIIRRFMIGAGSGVREGGGMDDRERPRRSLWMFGLESEEPSYEQRAAAAARLSQQLGVELTAPPIPPADALELRPPRISPPDHLAGFCCTSTWQRAYHSYGAERSLHGPLGRYPNPPDVVAHPRTEAEVEAVLGWCSDKGYCAIPYGGGSSVVGGVTPPADAGPVVTIALDELDQVVEVDEVSRAALIQAGAFGPHLEDQLRPGGH